MKKSIHISSCIMAALLALSAPAFAADGQGTADQTPKSKGSSESVAVKAPIVSSQGDDLVKPQNVTKESQQATALNSSRDGAYVRQTAESYWTSERMANATPIESAEQIADAQAQAAAGDSIKPMDEGKAAPEQVVAKPMAPTANASATKAETADGRVTNYSQTNGKVFFRNATNGKDYVCSGSSVTSSSKRLVITAGHCVHGGGKNGKWHQNWVFVPGYDRGKAPKGKFQAASLRAYKDWIDKGGNNSAVGFNSDVAFVTTHDGTSGGKVNEKVGGHGIIAGGSWTFGVDIFGYPANLDRGQAMKSCSSKTARAQMQSWYFYTVQGCNFEGGSSGGPWLQSYANGTGQGYVRSVTSHMLVGRNTIRGPYFDQRLAGLYKEADGSR